MKYKKYLSKGIKVSELGFGAWQLGVDSRASKPQNQWFFGKWFEC
jgi:aryl-alcohol dehydrogenase-like predicted oxidoreductase